MAKRFQTCRLLIALALGVCASLGLLAQAPQRAAAEPAHKSLLRIPDAPYPVTRSVVVGLSKSVVVELPRDVRDVVVSDPKKLEAVVNTARRAFLIGVEVGQANAFFFDKNGNQMATLEIRIERDLEEVTRMLHKLMPGADIKLEAVNDNIILTGSVPNPADSTRAADLVGRMVQSKDSEKSNVLNMLAVEAREQILLKVTVAEMNRRIVKQLGIDLGVIGEFGTTVIDPSGFGTAADATAIAQRLFGMFTNNGFTANGSVPPNLLRLRAGGDTWTTQGLVRAMERDGLLRTLAEPTLTAISGETANFLAGGEFPIPIAQEDNKITIEFKPFGVGLAFTPIVMSEGRISMKISTEVSELSNEGAITLTSVTIPALKVRRANTTIELPSGGSLVIAGLISEESKHAMEGIPGLKNLPILGNLFRSRDFVKSETELVIIVTPYTVKPVAREQLARPDRGFAQPTDAGAYLLGRLNRVYGDRPGRMPVGRYEGDYGFIID